MNRTFDIAIIGGGAAGLAAAIFALETSARYKEPLRLAVLDGAATLGAKILVSGGGRCNVTHAVVRPGDFHGAQPIIRNILTSFPVRETERWFQSIGVALKQEETGKLFPITDRARTVVDALLGRCRSLGAHLLTKHRVTDIHLTSEESVSAGLRFVIQHTHGTLLAQRVIMATGGRSLPRTGSDGFGWELVKRFGHTVTPSYPALVPLVLESSMFHAELSGLSHPVELITVVNNKVLDRRAGSLLWTHFGISGPVVMDSSRFWIIAQVSNQAVRVFCNFCPGEQFDDVEQWLLGQSREKPKMSIGKALGQRWPDRFGRAMCRRCRLDPFLQLNQVTKAQRRTLVHALTRYPMPITKDRGWNYAEVTAGGVPLCEIDYRSMASRRIPGLYLIGEMLDCDGRIGGFNFQWAWATGHIAGRAAAQSLRTATSIGKRDER